MFTGGGGGGGLPVELPPPQATFAKTLETAKSRRGMQRDFMQNPPALFIGPLPVIFRSLVGHLSRLNIHLPVKSFHLIHRFLDLLD